MSTPPEVNSQLAPIIVCSPTIRSGTTLLQRLLCSASNTIIYGETIAQDIELFLKLYVNKATVYRMNKAHFEGTRSKVVEQSSDEWMVDLIPDLEAYVDAIGQSCFAGLNYCHDYAIKNGCSVWGFKYPGWSPSTLTLIQRTMPKARVVYIYRDILNCVRSAKAWMPSWSQHQLGQLCVDWTTNLTYALSLSAQPNVLLMKYEELIARPGEQISQLATFTEAEGMHESILKRKINNFTEGGAASISGYRQPASLTDEELAIIEQIAMPLRSRVFPNWQ